MSLKLALNATASYVKGRAVVSRLICLLVLPQLPFWAARLDFSIDRPLFNLDLILATLVACVFRRIGLVLLCLAWMLDIGRAASLNYHFVSPIEFAATAKFADMVVVRQVLSWQLLLAVGALALCAAGVARVANRALMSYLVGAVMVLLLLDILNGSSQLFGLGVDRFRVETNVAGSPAWNIIQSERRALMLARLPMTRYDHPRTFDTIATWHRDHPRESVLLLLVESMGKPVSPVLGEWLGRKLATPAVTARWALKEGSDSFYGPTTFGELRVLCGLRGSYVNLKDGDESACLPNQWKAAGLAAYGVHGFHLRMFVRNQWWPRVGLQPWTFELMPSDGKHFGCNGAFPGVCDGSVLDAAVKLADQPATFVYALTLDTHLPLQSSVHTPEDLRALCKGTHTNDVACQMVGQLGSVLDSAATRIASMARPPLVVIVGDHSPPFAYSESRSAFDPGLVPLYTLTPKEATGSR